MVHREAVAVQGPSLRTGRRVEEREEFEVKRREKELAQELEKRRAEEELRREEEEQVARQRKQSVHKARPMPHYRYMPCHAMPCHAMPCPNSSTGRLVYFDEHSSLKNVLVQEAIHPRDQEIHREESPGLAVRDVCLWWS